VADLANEPSRGQTVLFQAPLTACCDIMAVVINMATILHAATMGGRLMVVSAEQPGSVPPSRYFEHQLLKAFRGDGWNAEAHVPIGSRRADLLVRKGRHRYVVELKSAAEGRRDRLVGLLSQAIIQASSLVSQASGVAPLAVVAAPRISDPVARALREFCQNHVPDVAVGFLDRDGLRSFVGPGLEALNSPSSRVRRESISAPGHSVNLFSDLNQWMLKVMLAPHIHRHDLLAERMPRAGHRNASELARAADVSIMSAFRFVRQLEQENFLDQSGGLLRLVRLEALLERWQSAYVRQAKEWPARWILQGGERGQLLRAMEALGDRACLGLFAAARALNLGHVEGAPVHIYVEGFQSERLREAGLSESLKGQPVSVVIRVPSARESVFRGAVKPKDLRLSDVLQVWLDVSAYPARGKEQASVIFRHVIRPMIQAANDQPR